MVRGPFPPKKLEGAFGSRTLFPFMFGVTFGSKALFLYKFEGIFPLEAIVVATRVIFGNYPKQRLYCYPNT